MDVDYRLFVGAGGGGAAPQGGGFVVYPSLSIGWTMGELRPYSEIGYTHFVNGNISSFSVAFGVSWTETKL